jgi:hypothetical protein
MTVLIYEDNLLWSRRLELTLAGAGHTAKTLKPTDPAEPADVAIVNLSTPVEALVPALQSLGVKVIAHAGHKEGAKLEAGRDLGCDKVATNSETTHHLPRLIRDLFPE